VGRAEKLDEAADDTSLDDFFNRRVTLFGEELPEFSGRLDLGVDLFGEDSLDHLRKILVELEMC